MPSMNLYQLPSGSWRVTVSIDGVRYRRTARTKGEATRLGAQLILDAGETPVGDTTVRDVIDGYLADAHYAPRTRQEINRAYAKLPEPFLERAAASVTPGVVAGLWKQMASAGRSRHELKRVRDLLGKAWRQALTLEWVSSNPIRLAPPPSPGQADEVHPPAPDEVREIIAASGKRSALALCLRLAAVTGARRGELCAIQWDDVRWNTDELVIRRAVAEVKGGLVTSTGKTGRGGHRVIPIDKPTLAALKKHTRFVGSPWVFTFDGVNPWRPSYVSREFDRITTRLAVDNSLHDLRHYAATQWLSAGVPVPTVAHLLGHASSATTLRVYAHWIPGQGREAIEAHAARLDAV